MSDVGGMIAGALHNDPVIQNRVRELALRSLDECERLIFEGSTPTKMQVMRTLMPAFVKALERSKEDEDIKDLKRQLMDLMTEMRNGPPSEEPEEDPDLLADVPGPPKTP